MALRALFLGRRLPRITACLYGCCPPPGWRRRWPFTAMTRVRWRCRYSQRDRRARMS
jgi:hypothetical protein